MTARATDTTDSLSDQLRAMSAMCRQHRNEFGVFCFLVGAIIGAVITGAIV